MEDTVKRYQALYDKFKGIYHALLLAQDEGVYEITVRSQTGVITVPVSFSDGTEIAAMMVENFSKRVDHMETLLNGQLEEAGHELAYDRKKAVIESEAREVEINKERARVAANLAQQAAATAAPAQKGPGRPRKAATPKPEVMEAVGAIAAQVPMNGSSPKVGGKANNLPQA